MGCHNDLKSFPWEKKKSDAERASCHKKKKKMNKSQTTYNFLGGTALLF